MLFNNRVQKLLIFKSKTVDIFLKYNFTRVPESYLIIVDLSRKSFDYNLTS